MRVYHFLSAKDAIDDIRKRRMKVSRIGDLNDPFELLARKLPGGQDRIASSRTNEEIGSMYGVLCFSTVWRDTLLWSHYADKHRGICLAFDVADELVCHLEYLGRRVPGRLRNGPKTLPIDEKYVRQALGMKFEGWDYEREVRVIVPLEEAINEGDLYFRRFDDKLRLKQVILGARCRPDQDTIACIQCRLRDYPSRVELIHARLAFRSFRIVENKAK